MCDRTPHKNCLATIGVCVFRALTSVGALFILLGEMIMKKFFVLTLSVFLCFILIGCGGGTNNDEPSANGTVNNGEIESQRADEEKVIAMFLQSTQRDADGSYRFIKRTSSGNVTFLYNFTYSPSSNLFTTGVLVATYGSFTMYDNAAATFSWGQFKKGLFSSYHELDSIARIEFEYSGLTFANNNIGTRYSYTVRSNSFSNLTEKSDIDDYAATGYEALQQAISYMNSVLYSHNLSVTLF